MNTKLLDKLMDAGSIKNASILSEAKHLQDVDIVKTDLPILNVAFSADLEGGLVPGVSIFAGPSKCYKSLLALYCLKAYFAKYPDAIALFYDSEFGVPKKYLDDLDTSRIIHLPILSIEDLKFDIVKKLDQIGENDHVFIMIDSLGNVASNKEISDAEEEKSVTDMTRAKAIRSLLRIITPRITLQKIPCVVINHTYQTMELYSKQVVGGGTAVTYAANQIFIIGRSQEKGSDGEIDGWNFTINIDKSRFVKEKSKFSFQVIYDKGVVPWSGLLDLAVEAGYVTKPSKGWYQKTGDEKKVRMAEVDTEEFWKDILADKEFRDFVMKKYSL